MLDRILPTLPKLDSPDLIVGSSTYDDAGVYRLSDELALVQTVDFFTPIVDDPYDFGRVAAVNSLSDVYAMGGKPVTALNILAFPIDDLPESVIAEILTGASDVCKLAGVAVAGGHSVMDKEIKFGLSVTGVIHPDKILTNSTAKAGDSLILTKPLGSGLVSTAMMNDAAKNEDVESMIAIMTTLNKTASWFANKYNASALTDVTGFGLLGHGMEMAKASNVEIVINADALPAMPGAMEVATSGSFYSGGERRNLKFVEKDLSIDAGVDDSKIRLASDPQTSGGLLVSLASENVKPFIDEMKSSGQDAWLIGEVVESKLGGIRLRK